MSFAARPLPPGCGIGLKPAHWAALIASPKSVLWVEIHAENYFGAGGPPHRALSAIRETHEVSIHGVGLSLGSAEGIDSDHLAKFSSLVRRYEPALVSEHLAWNAAAGVHVPDLLPLCYDDETLDIVAANVARTQDALGRVVGIENPARYHDLGGPLAETQFLSELNRRTGCGLLLDVNNVHVAARNLGFDPRAYLDAFPIAAVGEIHLAGHDRDAKDPQLLIDTHRGPVPQEVWQLYDYALAQLPGIPSLLEWDTDIPEFEILIGEARRANARDAACLHARAS